ncbi:MAG: secondary thiamine-phosphate synthase enzyme YjbQ [Paracoccus sp. (in: a-proteobacteria)]|uniref:secondary thiamine-phosphate synthase enzyme YjbQ n=1 Tax=Paracoccus sp. TaxID=267 RepID=UPI0026E0AC3C|nr:secondary thiamine-phosphate synthase enzyme YjbQ [Paracoccus sp. (in: a-proteobacteria)]MDO5622079.1 secondary thiamine-phosphate synthase enzyme YjbQ [Paracoccus sp. (in: a-proteobacteria)]
MIAGLSIETQGLGCYDITDRVAALLPSGDGLLTLFLRHTSCSLLIQENADPSVQRDLLAWLDRIAPAADAPGMGWITHRSEGPDDMPAHLKAAVLPTSLNIPFVKGRMVLGTWQGIYLVEHRSRPHLRHITLHMRPD